MAGRKAGHSVLRMGVPWWTEGGPEGGHSVLRTGVLVVDRKADWMEGSKAGHSVLRTGGLMVGPEGGPLGFADGGPDGGLEGGSEGATRFGRWRSEGGLLDSGVRSLQFLNFI